MNLSEFFKRCVSYIFRTNRYKITTRIECNGVFIGEKIEDKWMTIKDAERMLK